MHVVVFLGGGGGGGGKSPLSRYDSLAMLHNTMFQCVVCYCLILTMFKVITANIARGATVLVQVCASRDRVKGEQETRWATNMYPGV